MLSESVENLHVELKIRLTQKSHKEILWLVQINIVGDKENSKQVQRIVNFGKWKYIEFCKILVANSVVCL